MCFPVSISSGVSEKSQVVTFPALQWPGSLGVGKETFWGPNSDERAQLAHYIRQIKFDDMAAYMEDFSFSFSYEYDI